LSVWWILSDFPFYKIDFLCNGTNKYLYQFSIELPQIQILEKIEELSSPLSFDNYHFSFKPSK